jgi:uncharacterized membrane protein
MILLVATTWPTTVVAEERVLLFVAVVARVWREAVDAEARVELDILDDLGPCPIVLGKGSLEVLLEDGIDGAVYMRVTPGPCAISAVGL